MIETIGAVDANLSSLYIGCRVKLLGEDGVFTIKMEDEVLVAQRGDFFKPLNNFINMDKQDNKFNFIFDSFTIEPIQLSYETMKEILEEEYIEDVTLREEYVNYNAFSIISIWELYAKANNWCEKTYKRRSLSQDWSIGFREIEAFVSLLSS